MVMRGHALGTRASPPHTRQKRLIAHAGPGQPRHAGGISSSLPTLYCESNCDVCTPCAGARPMTTQDPPRASASEHHDHSCTLGHLWVHNIPSNNGLYVPSSKRSVLTLTPPARTPFTCQNTFQNTILCVQVTVVAPGFAPGLKEGSAQGTRGVHKHFDRVGRSQRFFIALLQLDRA